MTSHSNQCHSTQSEAMLTILLYRTDVQLSIACGFTPTHTFDTSSLCATWGANSGGRGPQTALRDLFLEACARSLLMRLCSGRSRVVCTCVTERATQCNQWAAGAQTHPEPHLAGDPSTTPLGGTAGPAYGLMYHIGRGEEGVHLSVLLFICFVHG